MAGHREEPRLGTAGGVGQVARFGKRALGFGPVGDVAADALHLGRPAGIAADQAFAPCDPSRAERAGDLLVMNPRAIRLKRGLALLKHGECEAAAHQCASRLSRQFAIGVVDKADGACRIAQHDQVALGFEQAAGALLSFLQFPIAVGQRLVMQRDLADFLAHPAQADAQGGKPDAGECEQEAGADRKGVRVIAGLLGSASSDESIGAAEGGGKDHERTNRAGEPRVASREAAYARFDPEKLPHRQHP